MRRLFSACLLAVTCLLGHGAASAQTADFSGQRVTIAIGTTTGGSYDLYARLASRHIGRFLPGHPAATAVNMPGAGGVIEANWLYNVAPKDGTAIALVPLSAAFELLLGGAQAQYDARRFNWLGSLNDYDGVAAVWAETPFHSARDMFEKEIVIGGGGSGSDITIWPNLLKTVLGAKIKLVNGYIGTANVFLAMERGEVQGMIGLDWDGVKSAKGDWLRDRKINILMQIADQRRADLADVPTVLELAQSAADRELLDLFIARQKYARPFAAPPGLPAHVLAALRSAFVTMARDPEFLRDAETAKMPINFAAGEEIASLAERIYERPKPLLERAANELRNANK